MWKWNGRGGFPGSQSVYRMSCQRIWLCIAINASMMSASYQPKGSRAQLERDGTFGPAFVAAKSRVSKMDVRYVEESDPLRQALLEIYVAMALDTPHNSFKPIFPR